MKTKILLVICWIGIASLTFFATQAESCMAFFDYEFTKGMNKICMYDHLGSAVAYTVKSYELCPLNLTMRH